MPLPNDRYRCTKTGSGHACERNAEEREVFSAGDLHTAYDGVRPKPVRKTAHFLRCHFTANMIILPRQARDKHRASTQKKSTVFLIGHTELQPDEKARCAQGPKNVSFLRCHFVLKNQDNSGQTYRKTRRMQRCFPCRWCDPRYGRRHVTRRPGHFLRRCPDERLLHGRCRRRPAGTKRHSF